MGISTLLTYILRHPQLKLKKCLYLWESDRNKVKVFDTPALEAENNDNLYYIRSIERKTLLNESTT